MHRPSIFLSDAVFELSVSLDEELNFKTKRLAFLSHMVSWYTPETEANRLLDNT